MNVLAAKRMAAPGRRHNCATELDRRGFVYFGLLML